jgi:hypothetical protein
VHRAFDNDPVRAVQLTSYLRTGWETERKRAARLAGCPDRATLLACASSTTCLLRPPGAGPPLR